MPMQRTLRSLVIGSVAVLGLVVSAHPAFAQDKSDKAKSGDKGGNAKVKTYDFSGDEIEGDLIKPDEFAINTRDYAKHGSLIRIRTNFIPEIVKSAEDL